MPRKQPAKSNRDLHILAVVGSLGRESVTRVVMREIAARLTARKCRVDLLDFHHEPLPLFNPDTAFQSPAFSALKERVERADVFVLGSPDYHGSMSSAMKSFLDHFWHEFAGKLFATVVVSHEKGLTASDQLRTVARQCNAWSLPYAVSVHAQDDVKGGKIAEAALRRRLRMLTRDIAVYGALLAQQRAADLAGTEPGFLARLRATKQAEGD
jgi:FMN reductase